MLTKGAHFRATVALVFASLLILVPPAPPALAITFTVNTAADHDDGLCTPLDCTLREAINASNTGFLVDTIAFNILPAGGYTINLLTPLPTITGAVTIDGYTQPGSGVNTNLPSQGGLNAIVGIAINGGGLAAVTDGLQISAGSSTVKGLTIEFFTGHGIRLLTNGGNHIEGNAIVGNGGSGVYVASGTGNTIGGTAAPARNVIRANLSHGVAVLGDGTTVQGNLVGLDSSGTAASGNAAQGVVVFSDNNTIGGSDAAARNVISANSASGVFISGGNGNQVLGNYIGTNVTGSAALANHIHGVVIDNGAANFIGGTAAGAGNLISGNTSDGVLMSSQLSSGNQVLGNFIGTNAAGSGALGNGHIGVDIANAPNNTVGGTAAGAGNLISGNGDDGVRVGSHGTQVIGNRIGTNAAGSAPLANSTNGIEIIGPANTVGGTSVAARNVISGNGSDGVLIQGVEGTGNQVLGNFIGTNATGTASVGNSFTGVYIENASNNTVGGATAGAGNVISGNVHGVVVDTSQGPSSTNNRVLGNFIGTNAAGDAALGNSADGVGILGSTTNTIGGATAGAGNVISGNAIGVALLFQAAGSQVLGNLIGTNAAGTAAIQNTQGVVIQDAPSNTIGGDTAGARNVISGNQQEGVNIVGASATSNQVLGNFIGSNAAGTSPLGNGLGGVGISGAPNNTIGGPAVGAGNLITGNTNGGVFVSGGTATGNSIQRNSIFANTGLGIDLGFNSVTLNDVGDTDVGPNNLQNYPVLTSAVNDGVQTTVSGTLDTTPGTQIKFDFYRNVSCDPSGYGEGEAHLAGVGILTLPSGISPFSVQLGLVPVGQVITATATDPGGNTSEFSHCVTVTSPATPTPTPSLTPTSTPTASQTLTASQTSTPTATGTPSATRTPTPSQTSTTTATSTPSATVAGTPSPSQLNGTVALEGLTQGTNPYQVPLVVRLLQPGTEADVPGSPFASMTDVNGNFSVSGLPLGTFDIDVKNPQRISRRLYGVTLPSGGQPRAFGLLLAGDVNNSNFVNLSDYNLLRATFLLSEGDPGYNPQADFNGSTFVNLSDYNLLRANFLVEGPLPGGP